MAPPFTDLTAFQKTPRWNVNGVLFINFQIMFSVSDVVLVSLFGVWVYLGSSRASYLNIFAVGSLELFP